MAATTQTRVIRIKVDANGVKEALDGIAKSMGGISRNTKSLAGDVGFLKNAFLGYLGTLSVRELATMSDEMQNLSNRIKLVSRATEDSNVVMKNLLDLANETKQSVSEVGEVYARLGSSLKFANASSESLLAVSKTLINSFRISGSTGAETTATIIQLSQAFASGTLRGQELRSVMLQNAELARLLRERFGNSLADKAEKGLIKATEVLKILRDNMERINESALRLTPTFEQTLTKALNAVRFGLFQLNEQFNISGKFAVVVDSLTDSFKTLFKVMVDAGKIVADNIDWAKWIAGAFGVLAVLNPLGASILVVSGAIVASSDSVGDFIDKLRNLGAWIVQLDVYVKEFSFTIEKTYAKALKAIGVGVGDKIQDLALQLDQINDLKKLATELGTQKYAPVPLRDEAPGSNAQKSALQKLIDDLDKKTSGGDKILKIKEILGQLNKELTSGSITLEEYNTKFVDFELYKLNRQFEEGKLDIFQYNEQLTKLKEQDLNRFLKSNIITLSEFKDAVSQLKIEELNAKFQAGKITLIEYNQELIKVSRQFEPGGALIAGTQAYLDSIGTTSSQVADAIKSTFGALENSLLDFIKKGKFNFADFTQGILDDLSKIIIRATIIKPLAEAVLGSFGGGGGTTQISGGSGSTARSGFAHGGAFDHGLKKFAKGDIISSPTTFGYGANKTGLMGEAGAEAILPLKRGSGGNLGVAATVTPVTVNIINQSGNEVQQSERTGPNGEKTIEILVTNRVREGIASGKFDSVLKQSFALNRKGS